MGVITCDRLGCYNIMSEYNIHGVGDCCAECVQEFKDIFYQGGDIMYSFERFMKTQKTELNYNQKEELDEFFKQYARNF